MLEICIQTSYNQNFQSILKKYLPVVYGTPLSEKEEIEDTTVVIRSRKLMKDRQYNGQKNIGQTVIYKKPHRKLNIEVILCSGKMSSSCSTRNIRHITVKQH